MIPYEELCAALERYAAETRGEAPPVNDLAPLSDTTGQTTLPPVGMGDDDHTSVGVQAIYDDKSNELDIGDVLSDEEAPKN